MQKHTTGPWVASLQGDSTAWIICTEAKDKYGRRNKTIVRHSGAEGVGVGLCKEEVASNAALISAAPELLYVCQWVLNTLRDAVVCPDGCPDELESAIVAAITKAEGR